MAEPSEFPSTIDGSDTLQRLDAAARCSICYSYYDAPLTLRGCGHSFCSSCIRQNIDFQEKSGDPQCPSCRSACDARDLQPNVALRELTERYAAARDVISRLLADQQRQQLELAQQQQQELQQRRQGEDKSKLAPATRTKRHSSDKTTSKPTARTIEAEAEALIPPKPRRSSRRSNAGKARDEAAAAAAASVGVKLANVVDDEEPRPSTRSTRSRRKTTSPARAAGDAQSNGDSDFCVEVLSEEEEEEGGSERGEEIEEESSSGEEYVVEDEEHARNKNKDRYKKGLVRKNRDRGGDGESDGSSEIEVLDNTDEDEEGEEEELSPSPPMKKQRKSQNGHVQQQDGIISNGKASQGAAPVKPSQSTPNGFVECPICAKSVPSFYINSHVDKCLSSGGTAGTAPPQQADNSKPSTSSAAAAKTAENIGSLHAQNQPSSRNNPSLNHQASLAAARSGPLRPPPKSNLGPFVPLAAPPRIVPTLASEKSIRTSLKKYGLPSDGKKAELLERYNQFRLAVATANDRQEHTSFARLAQRVVAQERQRAAAALLGGGIGKVTGGAAGGRAGSIAGIRAAMAGGNAGKSGRSGVGSGAGDGIILMGCSFKELIAVTKARDAARRAARSASATAGAIEAEAAAPIDGPAAADEAAAQPSGDTVPLVIDAEDQGWTDCSHGGSPAAPAEGAPLAAEPAEQLGRKKSEEPIEMEIEQEDAKSHEQEQYHPNPGTTSQYPSSGDPLREISSGGGAGVSGGGCSQGAVVVKSSAADCLSAPSNAMPVGALGKGVVIGGLTREATLAEELRQAHEIAAQLDTDDDDNW